MSDPLVGRPDAGSLAFYVRDLIAAAGYHYNPNEPLHGQIRECDDLIRLHRQQLNETVEELVNTRHDANAAEQRDADLIAELRRHVEIMGRSLDGIGRLRKTYLVGEQAGDVVQILADALLIIGERRCSNYVGSSCQRSGRGRRAEFTAERWCDECIARDALDRAGWTDGE